MRQLAATGLSLNMAMGLNDVRICYIVFVSVPASAVRDNWCLEVGCIQPTKARRQPWEQRGNSDSYTGRYN